MKDHRSVSRIRRALASACLCLPLAACGLPHDQRGAVNDIEQSGVIRVGAAGDRAALSEEQAWIDQLAAEMGVSVSLTEDETHALVKALREGELDLVIGLPAETPFKKEIGMSRPYLNARLTPAKRIWAVRPGENAWLYRIDGALLRQAPQPS